MEEIIYWKYSERKKIGGCTAHSEERMSSV